MDLTSMNNERSKSAGSACRATITTLTIVAGVEVVAVTGLDN